MEDLEEERDTLRVKVATLTTTFATAQSSKRAVLASLASTRAAISNSTTQFESGHREKMTAATLGYSEASQELRTVDEAVKGWRTTSRS